MLQKAADGQPTEIAQQVVAGMDYQRIADLVVAALGDPQRPAGETAAALRSALGDRAAEVGRLLSA